MLSLLTLAVLVGGYVAVRRLPPVPVVLDPRRRLIAWGLAACGAAALFLMAAFLFTAGDGPLAFFLFLPHLCLPPLVAAVAALRTGRRLHRGLAASRVTAVAAGLALAGSAGIWSATWRDFTPDSDIWYLGSQQGIDATSAALGVLALVTGLASVALVERPRALTWETGAAFVGVALAVNLTGASIALSLPRADQFTVDGQDDARCVAADDRLQDLDFGSPQPPLLTGLPVVGATVVPAVISGDLVDDFSYAQGDNATLVVAQRLPKRGADRLEEPARKALAAAGLEVTGVSRGEINDEVTSLSLQYKGEGVTGSISYDACDAGAFAVIAQEIRPDRVGACRELLPPCAAVFDAGAPAVAVLQGLSRTKDSPRPLPTLTTTDGRAALTVEVVTDSPMFFFLDELGEALVGAGLTQAELRCGTAECELAGAGFGGPVVGTWTHGGLRAVLRLSPDGRDRARVQLVVTG